MKTKSNWEMSRLLDLGDGKRPVLKSGPFGSSLTKASYVNDGYRLYGQQEVLARDVKATTYYISDGAFRRNQKCSVRSGDVLITTMGTLGRTFVVPEGAPPGIINPRLIRIVVDGERLDPRFLDYFLSSPSTQIALGRKAHGGTMSGLNSQALGKLMVPVPPLPEQRKIAKILGVWDDAIEKLLSICRLRKSALDMQSNNTFVPMHSDNVSGTPLGDLFSERAETGDAILPLLSVTQRNGIIRQSAAGRKDSSSTDRARYKRVFPQDVAYNTMRMWQGASGLVQEEGIVSPAYTVVVPRTSAIEPRFAAYLFKNRRIMFDFERYSQGLTSDTWNLKYPAFAKIRVSIPDVRIQDHIANHFEAAEAELALIDREIALLREQKRGLMQKLLTGDIRVTVGPTEEARP